MLHGVSHHNKTYHCRIDTIINLDNSDWLVGKHEVEGHDRSCGCGGWSGDQKCDIKHH